MTWKPDGTFAAVGGQVGRVLGWAEDAEVITELLGRLDIETCRDGFSRADGTRDVRPPYPPPGFRYPFDFIEDVRALLAEGHSRLEELLDHLAHIRRQIPTSEIGLRGWIRERARELQRGSPQVQTIQAFSGDLAVENLTQPKPRFRGLAEYCGWVDPRLIVATPDNVWADFGDRRPDTVPAIVRSVRDADTDAARRMWISQMYWTDSLPDLVRVEGPAGPIYEVGMGGSHRTHAARVLELPCVPAEVHLAEPSYPTAPGYPWALMEPIWERLRRRQVITARIHVDEEVGKVWTPRAVTAQWTLLAPEHAVPVNRAYERLYPGALAGLTRLPVDCLVDEQQWIAALTTPTLREKFAAWLTPPSRLRSARRSY